MEFTIPQFIEQEAKIVGPFTFKQFIFVGTACGISILFYFILPLFLFIILAIPLLGGAFALAFLKVSRTSLPTFIVNFFAFLFKPKVYLWNKKTGSPKFLKKEREIVHNLTKEENKNEGEEGVKLKVSRGSRLDELLTKLETK